MFGLTKYTAYRIDTSSIKNNKVVQGFFVRGQHPDNLDWPIVAEASSMWAALEYIRIMRQDRQPVYGPDGCVVQI